MDNSWIPFILGGGGVLTGTLSLLKGFFDSKKIDAETRKIGAEEEKIRTESALALVKPYQEQYVQVWSRLTQQEKDFGLKISALEKQAHRSEQEAVQLRRRLVQLEEKMSQLRQEQAAERSKYQEQIRKLRSELVEKESLITNLRVQLGST